MEWEKVLKKIEEEYELSVGTEDEKRIAEDLSRLRQWLQSGRPGECPIDLSRYGLEGVSLARTEEPPSRSAEETTIVPPMEEELTVESIAEEEIRRQEEPFRKALREVQQLMSKGKWAEAWNQARSIEQHTQGELREQAARLASNARARLEEHIADLHQQAQEALEQGKVDLAKRRYHQILELDPEDRRARSGLYEIEQKEGRGFNWSELRAGLKEQRDIKRLGEAVYQAEALDAEGYLPEDLRVLLQEARTRYDETRRQMGEETTMMRWGDLSARAEALEKIRQRIVRGENSIFDITIGRERPILEVLQEAEERLKKASKETAQYELNIAEKHLRTSPRYVRGRLEKAIQGPFTDEDRNKLKSKLAEAEEWVRREEEAAQRQQQARDEQDPMKKLSLLLQAYGIFPELVGLKEELERARQIALATVRVQVQQLISEAKMLLDVEEFNDARKRIGEARQRIEQWPEELAAQELQALSQQIEALQKQLAQREKDQKEYQQQAKRIRQWVRDPHQRERALSTFQKMKGDARFTSFRDFSVLESEVEQYKSIQEQLADAQQAREEGDWKRVYEISQRLLRGGQAGEFAKQVQELYDEAVIELDIGQLRDLLERDEIFAANNILTLLFQRAGERSPELEASLRQRLSTEGERIKVAIHATSSIQPLYNEALRLIGLTELADHLAFRTAQELQEGLRSRILSLLQQQGIQRRWEALKRFRYIGGEETKAEEGWPPYALSLRTAEARRVARLVEESLHASLVEPLRERYAQYLQSGDKPDDEECRQLAEWAAIAREGKLAQTEEEHRALQWAEVEWGKRRALREEKAMRWQEAIYIWKQLLQLDPNSSEIRKGLRNARIQHAVWKAHDLAYNHHEGESALELIQELQNEPEMENAWELNLTLAEVYSLLGNFESAFANVERAERIAQFWPEASERERLQYETRQAREKVESMQRTKRALEECERHISGKNYVDALRTLQSALQDAKIKEGERMILQESLERFFKEGKQELLEKIREQEEETSDASKVAVVVLLLDLQRLETQMGIPEQQQEAFPRLQRLRSKLEPAAEAIIREVSAFQPQLLPLEGALQRAGELRARLQAFEEAGLFASESETSRALKKHSVELDEIYQRLGELKKLLEEGEQPERWEEALQSGNFDWLERQYRAMANLGMSFNEVLAFRARLDEVKEVHKMMSEAISRIREMFLREENFEGVQQEILTLSNLPATRPGGGPWQTIRAKEYRHIRESLSTHLRIVDPSTGQEIVGWDEVKRQAIERAEELQRCIEWGKRCGYLLDKLQQSLAHADSSQDMPYRISLRDWEEVKSLIQQALEVLKAPPVSSPRSRKIREILEEGRRHQSELEQNLQRAEDEIQRLQKLLEREPFPTPEELNEAASRKDWTRLERLLSRAEQAGALTPEEERRIRVYRQVLEEETRPSKRKGFKFF